MILSRYLPIVKRAGAYTIGYAPNPTMEVPHIAPFSPVAFSMIFASAWHSAFRAPGAAFLRNAATLAVVFFVCASATGVLLHVSDVGIAFLGVRIAVGPRIHCPLTRRRLITPGLRCVKLDASQGVWSSADGVPFMKHVVAAALMGIDQPKVSALLNGHLASFSSERLMRLLTRLGQDVEIVVKAKPRRRHHGRISVVDEARA